ncbi:DeoR family transcriptional regulator [Maribacter litopenaei]|uniref:DeoR family transcriptional regulator n=1 Tax=Maribacter litopenaei TaxID=2976127 RepID=UPI003B846192
MDILKEDGSAKVAALSKIFKVTEVTIRQDLEKLEEEGLIVREHGGAYLKDMADQSGNLILANQDNLDLKEAIAQKCIDFIESGDTIILGFRKHHYGNCQKTHGL